MPKKSESGGNRLSKPQYNCEQAVESLKQKELLTRQEAAEYVGTSISMLYYYMHRNDTLKSAKIMFDNRVYFKRATLDQWINSRNEAINALIRNAKPLQDIMSIRAEKELLKHKELLTAREAATYLGLSIKVLYAAIKRGDISNAKIKCYRRTYFRRALLDCWLEERDRNDKRYKYIVTKISTNEIFIIDAKSRVHARRKACKADGVGEARISNYKAKKISDIKKSRRW